MSYPSKSSPSLACAIFSAFVEFLALTGFFGIMALAAVLANHSF